MEVKYFLRLNFEKPTLAKLEPKVMVYKVKV